MYGQAPPSYTGGYGSGECGGGASGAGFGAEAGYGSGGWPGDHGGRVGGFGISSEGGDNGRRGGVRAGRGGGLGGSGRDDDRLCHNPRGDINGYAGGDLHKDNYRDGERREEDLTTKRVRIYVGGLGESVTSDDLCQTFSKTGVVIEAVDVVKTKGRSFAYIDLPPNSHNSLSKLFSTYNGCAWKGGRLRLEKAKEHYLDRLKREWDEDAQLVNSSLATNVDCNVDNIEPSEKPKKDISSEKKQLQIFFPKLRKVKSIPFNGTGKHKYSFRRVEVPTLPMYFCDCEEHCGPLYAAEEKRIPIVEEQGSGMNKEEIDMMNSVMNKLFEMENVSSTTCGDVELTKEEDYSVKVTNDLQLDETEGYSTADEDNLIINVVRRGQETTWPNQDSQLNKRKASNGGPTQPVLKKKTRNQEENDTNKRVSAVSRGKESLQTKLNGSGLTVGAQHIESQSSGKHSAPSVVWSQKSSWRELVGDMSNTSIHISDIMPGASSSKDEQSESYTMPTSNDSENKKLPMHENQSDQLDKKVEGTEEAQPTKMDSALDKGGRGSAWLHKSSWTHLVTNSNNNQFSITQILPGITFDKQEPAKPDGALITNSRGNMHDDMIEKRKSESAVDGAVELRIGRDSDAQRSPEPSKLILGSSIASAPTASKYNSATKLPRSGDVANGDTCSFKRTDSSLKEWTKIKAALSGSRKRTNKEK